MSRSVVGSGRWQRPGQALLDHVSAAEGDVQVAEGEIRVSGQERRSVYRIDSDERAAYLNRVEAVDHLADDLRGTGSHAAG